MIRLMIGRDLKSLYIPPAAEPGASFLAAGLLLGPFYAAIGVFTASSYALFMDHTEPAVAATQFTAFMALTNACESWAVFSWLRRDERSATVCHAQVNIFASPREPVT